MGDIWVNPFEELGRKDIIETLKTIRHCIEYFENDDRFPENLEDFNYHELWGFTIYVVADDFDKIKPHIPILIDLALDKKLQFRLFLHDERYNFEFSEKMKILKAEPLKEGSD